MSRQTMSTISYGLNTPNDIFDKLIFESEKIDAKPHPYDLFNFFVTSAVLEEWIKKYYATHFIGSGFIKAMAEKNPLLLPIETSNWLLDKSCLPNTGDDERKHVFNAMRICWDTANASKHYHWKIKDVSAIENEPQIKNYYQWCFTSVESGIYIEFSGQYYTVKQIKNILIQFYSGLLEELTRHGDR